MDWELMDWELEDEELEPVFLLGAMDINHSFIVPTDETYIVEGSLEEEEQEGVDKDGKEERFKYTNFQIAFLVEQLKEETDEDVIKHVSKKIREYEEESKRIARSIMKFRYRSRIGRE